MPSPKIKDVLGRFALVAMTLAVLSAPAVAEVHEKIRIAVGRSEVVPSNDEVRTVAIAEPKIADAAVGSQRTVIVSGKSEGMTTLVVYGEGGRFTIYDIEVYVPNGDRQVLLHVRVAEVNNEASRDLGVDWFSSGRRDGVVLSGGLFTGKIAGGPVPPLEIGPSTDGKISLTNAAGDFHIEAVWKALEERGAIRMLANPTLLAKSGEDASFLAGGEFPVAIASSGGVGGTSAVTIEWKEFGIKVDFKPTVAEDGTILLKVMPEVSQLDFSKGLVLNGFNLPTVISRKTSTTVQLKGGEHLVIGGLKQTDRTRTVRRVPILGRIPLLGFFFSASHTDDVERELVVVVSPELISGGSTTLPALPTDGIEKK